MTWTGPLIMWPWINCVAKWLRNYWSVTVMSSLVNFFLLPACILHNNRPFCRKMWLFCATMLNLTERKVDAL